MEPADNIVPEQNTGKAIEAKATVAIDSLEEARKFFRAVRRRLEGVNDWHQIAQNISAEFTLVTATGEILKRAPERGDYFKINIPGPGTKAGNGYDWVQVEEIIEINGDEKESYGFRVRPAANPSDSSKGIAHFYSPQSTSTFIVSRDGLALTAEIFDRNIKPNEEATETVDIIRDAVVGAAGQMGFSKVQWKGLAEGLVRR